MRPSLRFWRRATRTSYRAAALLSVIVIVFAAWSGRDFGYVFAVGAAVVTPVAILLVLLDGLAAAARPGG